MLNQIAKLYPKVKLTNIEFIEGYRKHQVSSKINFICASILNSNLKDKTFDCLIIRDVLHHVIGQSFRESKENQKTALKELWRLLRPGGAIFIEELVSVFL